MSEEVVTEGSNEDAGEGYKEVQLGPKTLTVPTQWKIKRFDSLYQKRNESIQAAENESIKYIGLKHLEGGNVFVQGYEENGRDRSSSRAFCEGDVLFGKLRPNLEKAAVAPFDGICSSDIIPIYSESNAEQEFLPYLMHSKLIRDRVVSTMEGTNLPRTSWSALAATRVPVPSVQEQRRIADILSTVDKELQQTDEIIRKTKKLKRGLINELVKKGIDEKESFSKVQIGPKRLELPVSWDVLRVDELVSENEGSIRTGPFGSKLKEEYLVSEGVKVYEQRNVYEQDFTLGNRYVTQERYESELTSYDARPGDVLITLQGTVGDAGVIPSNAEEGIINQKLMRVRVDEDACLPEYFAMFFDESKVANYQIEAVSHGAVVSGLNISTISGIRVPLPPITEQREIVKTRNTVVKKLKEERERKQHLQELKRGLMQDFLTGKVRVDPEQADT